MTARQYITLHEFSAERGLEITLIREFADFGLLTLHVEQEQECISAEDTAYLERLVRLHNDLGINKEGIEIIVAMREQLIAMSRELEVLRQKSHRLEEEIQLRFVELPRRRGRIIDVEE